MVRLYAINIFYKDFKPVQKKAAYELSSFGFFQRNAIREFMAFSSSVIVERTQVGQRQTVKEQDYLCHVYVRSDQLACVVITDKDYPTRVCFTVMNKVLDMYSADFTRSSWSQAATDLSYPPLDTLLAKYQEPREADPLMKVQADLDETKIVLHETLEAMMQRGEKLDDLVSKTDMLSGTSKAFYKEAKGNSCCVLL
ncbi:hypothetical protein EMCRGX_G028930 [Ephydatia muelleri]|eukprot:Em0013g1092a